jgi:exopolysaccharide production protein ExoZ
LIYNLQVLRAFAAISVVFLHVTSDAGLGVNLGVGGYGVDLFFVISGFTMAYIGQIPAGTFFLRRCIRIVPLYWAATLGTFFVSWAAPNLVDSAAASIPHLLHSLAFLPYPNKLGEMQPTLALGWTLEYEMYFYALFTVALVIAPRYAAITASSLLLIIAATIRIGGSKNKAIMFYSDPIVYEFIFGIFVYYAVKAVTAVPRKFGDLPKRVILFVSAIAAVAVLLMQESLLSQSRVVFAGLPSALLVFSLVVIEQKYRISLATKWLVLLGDASYVLYLTHPFVVYGAIRLCMRPLPTGSTTIALATLGLMLLAIIAAITIHVILESPILDLLRRRLTPHRTAPLPI